MYLEILRRTLTVCILDSIFAMYKSTKIIIKMQKLITHTMHTNTYARTYILIKIQGLLYYLNKSLGVYFFAAPKIWYLNKYGV